MRSSYKDGTPVPVKEIASMMIALLMTGQHSSSVTSSWIMLHLAAQPSIMEKLYQEQIHVLGIASHPITHDDLLRLPLHANVMRETLRLHPPIHSIMRKVTSPLPVSGTNWVIPVSYVLLAAPGVMSVSTEYFSDPQKWDPHRWDDMVDAEEEKENYGYGLVSTGASSPYLPFGAGRHHCIGEQFAKVQILTIVAVMMREFRLCNVEGKQGVVKTGYSPLFSRPQGPAHVAWEKRNKA